MSVVFIEVAIKTSFLLATAATANLLLYRRASAASRHLVWTLAFVGLILLPILSAALPSWEIAIRAATAKAPGAVSRLQPTEPKMEAANSVGVDRGAPIPATALGPAPSTSIASPIQWATVLPAMYAAGVFLLLLRLVA